MTSPQAEADHDLLNQYEAAVPPSPKDDSGTDGAEVEPTPEQVDALLQDDAVDPLQIERQRDPALDALRGENAQLRDHIWREREQADFKSLVADVQSQLPDHVEPDFAETQLLAMAMRDPILVAAFDLRNADKREVSAELKRIENTFKLIKQNPALADQQKIAALQDRQQQLTIAFHAKSILQKAVREVISRGRKFRPVDLEQTADNAMVAAAVRDGGSGKAMPPEPPLQLGNMGRADFRNHVRERYGFDPGV